MDKTGLVKEVIELHRRANRVLKEFTPDAWMELNLTISQLKSLMFIAHHEGTNFTRLAAALGVTPANVTGIVDRLVEQGLVSRQENPEDRRMLILRLTRKGESTVSTLSERRVSHLSEILSRLTAEDLNAVARGLELLAGAAEAHEKILRTKPESYD